MGEGRPKVCPINVSLSGRFWEEESMTSGAKDIHRVIPWQIREADRQNRLSLAKHPRATSKGSSPVLLIHCVHPTICQYITRVDESVQHLGCRLYNFLLLFC
mmetsp:Transcript_3663/g.7317  ORF Transcript_3663/g.7317 Transcript_3663/m.7317 type:complete len:102 (-) Transcript_3663:926-1231(-)